MSILGMRQWSMAGPYVFGGGAVIYPSSYWHSLSRGDRTASITVTTTATLGAGTINNLIDGAFSADGTDACWFGSGQSSQVVKFDFGAAYVVDGFRWFQDSASSHGTWVLEGSNDDSSYTAIGSSFTLGGAAGATYEFTNTVAYRYYRLRQTAGTTSSSPWLREIEFRIAAAGGSSGDALETGNRTSLITASTTATAGNAGATIDNLVDGAFGVNTSDSFTFTTGESTRSIKFDLGVGVSKIFTGFRWLQNNTVGHGTWVLEGSNDDSSYTGLGSSFTLGGVTSQVFTFTNTTAYRYYRLRQTAGTTSNSPWLIEIDFKVP